MNTKTPFFALLALACLTPTLDAQLSPKTVDVMTSNQVGNLFNWTPGVGFGLAFYTVDRVLVMAFMIQQSPYGAEVQSRFPTLVYQALVEPRK